MAGVGLRIPMWVYEREGGNAAGKTLRVTNPHVGL